jgi:hypothetical protein
VWNRPYPYHLHHLRHPEEISPARVIPLSCVESAMPASAAAGLHPKLDRWTGRISEDGCRLDWPGSPAEALESSLSRVAQLLARGVRLHVIHACCHLRGSRCTHARSRRPRRAECKAGRGRGASARAQNPYVHVDACVLALAVSAGPQAARKLRPERSARRRE